MDQIRVRDLQVGDRFLMNGTNYVVCDITGDRVFYRNMEGKKDSIGRKSMQYVMRDNSQPKNSKPNHVEQIADLIKRNPMTAKQIEQFVDCTSAVYLMYYVRQIYEVRTTVAYGKRKRYEIIGLKKQS